MYSMLFHCPCTNGLIPLNTCFTLCLKGENKSPYCTFHPCLSSTRSKSKVFPAQKSPSLKPSTCVKRNRFLNKACDWRWERGTGLFFALYPNIDAASIFGSSEVHILFSLSHTHPPLISSPWSSLFYINHVTCLPCYLKLCGWGGMENGGGGGYFG